MKTKHLIGSPSAYATWHECPEKFRLTYKEHWRPIHRPTVFHFGEWLHLLLEHYYKGGDPQEIVQQYTTDKGAIALSERDVERYAQCRAMLMGVAAAYPKWAGPMDSRYEILEVEHSEEGSLADYHPGLDLVGRLDLLVRVDDQLFVLDHKSCAMGRQHLVTSTAGFGFQALTYVAMKQAQGIIHNMIARPALRLRKSETLDEFCDRITEDYTKRPTDYFQRHRTIIDPEEAAFTVRTQLMSARAAQQVVDAISPDQYPRNDRVCLQASPCPFLPYCQGKVELTDLYERRVYGDDGNETA